MPEQRDSFLVIGHRGDGAGPDENTVASCRRAIAAGADAVELDVRLRRGELVLGHGRRGIRRAARLANVLPKLRVPVVLHLKRAWFWPWHDRIALRQIASLHHRPGLTVSSRWPGTLTYAKRRFPKLRTAFITEWPGWDLRFAERLGAAEYHGWHGAVTERAVKRAARQRLPLIAFVPSGQAAEKLHRRGVSGVITDLVGTYR